MNIANRIAISLCSLLLLSSTSIRAFDDAQLQLYQDFLKNNTTAQPLDDKYIKELDELTLGIDSMLEGLACLVEPNAFNIKEKEKRRELLQAIIQTRTEISSIRKDFINQPNKEQYYQNIQILNALLDHLEKALKKDFRTFKAFDSKDCTKRSCIPDELEIEELEELFSETSQTFDRVKKTSEGAGLSALNHAYRKSIDPIVQWCSKHNAHWKLAGAALVATFGTYLFYHISEDTTGLPIHLGGDGSDAYNKDDNIVKQWLYWAYGKYNHLVRSTLKWPAKETNGRTEQMLRNAIEDALKTDLAPETIASLSAPGNEFTPESIQSLSTAANDALSSKLAPEAIQTLQEAAWNLSPTEYIGRCGELTAMLKLRHLLGGSTDLFRPTGLMNSIEEFGKQHAVGGAFIGAALYKLQGDYGIFNKAIELKNYLQKKALELHYRLKGGAFYQRFKMKKDSFRIDPKYTFDDVVGLDHAKNVLRDILKYLENPEEYARRGVVPALTYLMYGESRTGKSMLAEALAGELQKLKGNDLPFYVIPPIWIANEGSFGYVMEIMKEKAPCVIFIDEIDLLNLNRHLNTKNVLLSEFLETMSGCMNADPDKPVIIIAATNAPENLAKPLRKRFFSHIPFELPPFISRFEFLARELESKGLPIEQFDLKKLAEQTDGCTYQDLKGVIDHAQFMARETGRPISQTDVEYSLNTRLRNIIFHDYKHLTDKDSDILSAHMTGHAIAHILLEDPSRKLSLVTTRPVKVNIGDDALWNKRLHIKKAYSNDDIIRYGRIFTHPTTTTQQTEAQDGQDEQELFMKNMLFVDSLHHTSRDDYKRNTCIALAGCIAEEILLGTHHVSHDTCSSQDMAQAHYWAEMYCLNGQDRKQIVSSKKMQHLLQEDTTAFVQQCEQEMRELFSECKELLFIAMQALKEQKILDAEVLEQFVLVYHLSKKEGKTMEEMFQETFQQMMNTMQPDATADGSSEDTRIAMQNELGITEVPDEAIAQPVA